MKKQQGLTLIELMISLALGMIIMAATLSIYISTIKSSADTIKSARLNHDLEMAISLMSNDIKRAGYWGNARVDANSRANPFTITAATANTAASAAPNNVAPYNFKPTDVNILNFTDTAGVAHANGCILYSYDANSNGHYDNTPSDTTYTVNDTNEFLGFRLNAGKIEMRLTGTTTADCTEGAWQAITDENMVNITDLQFSFVAMAATTTAPVYSTALTATSRWWNLTLNTTDVGTLSNSAATTANPFPHDIVVKRVVNIRMTGGLIGADNAEVIKSMSDSVEIRSNRLYQKTS